MTLAVSRSTAEIPIFIYYIIYMLKAPKTEPASEAKPEIITQVISL